MPRGNADLILWDFPIFKKIWEFKILCEISIRQREYCCKPKTLQFFCLNQGAYSTPRVLDFWSFFNYLIASLWKPEFQILLPVFSVFTQILISIFPTPVWQFLPTLQCFLSLRPWLGLINPNDSLQMIIPRWENSPKLLPQTQVRIVNYFLKTSTPFSSCKKITFLQSFCSLAWFSLPSISWWLSSL